MLELCYLAAVTSSFPRGDGRGWIPGSEPEKWSLRVCCHMQNHYLMYHICHRTVDMGNFCTVGRYSMLFSLFLGLHSTPCTVSQIRHILSFSSLSCLFKRILIQGTMALTCLSAHHHRSFIFIWDPLPFARTRFCLVMFFKKSPDLSSIYSGIMSS